MIVNELIIKVMIYGKHNKACLFIFNAKTLQMVEEYKYLGVILNSAKTSKGDIFKQMGPQRQVFQFHKNVNKLVT